MSLGIKAPNFFSDPHNYNRKLTIAIEDLKHRTSAVNFKRERMQGKVIYAK